MVNSDGTSNFNDDRRNDVVKDNDIYSSYTRMKGGDIEVSDFWESKGETNKHYGYSDEKNAKIKVVNKKDHRKKGHETIENGNSTSGSVW
jgi:hypothetical protein